MGATQVVLTENLDFAFDQVLDQAEGLDEGENPDMVPDCKRTVDGREVVFNSEEAVG